MHTDVTRNPRVSEAGEPNAAGELLPLVSAVLRRLASRARALERPDMTLRATALVHEAYWNNDRGAPSYSATRD